VTSVVTGVVLRDYLEIKEGDDLLATKREVKIFADKYASIA
jgi:bifunctional DNA-binding transcriptional regulator/antitoxin component of YhaV-PrlF toxin-antitoxin module